MLNFLVFICGLGIIQGEISTAMENDPWSPSSYMKNFPDFGDIEPPSVIGAFQPHELQLTEPILNPTLNLERQKINDAQAKELADKLRNTTHLTDLKLRMTSISTEGVRYLAEALKLNISLTHLNITENGIGVNGARILAEMLQYNKSLIKLEVGHNNIGDEGATALAKALEFNDALRELNLEGNNITQIGAQNFADILRSKQNSHHNKTLNKLSLDFNAVGNSRLIQSIRSFLHRNEGSSNKRQKPNPSTRSYNQISTESLMPSLPPSSSNNSSMIVPTVTSNMQDLSISTQNTQILSDNPSQPTSSINFFTTNPLDDYIQKLLILNAQSIRSTESLAKYCLVPFLMTRRNLDQLSDYLIKSFLNARNHNEELAKSGYNLIMVRCNTTREQGGLFEALAREYLTESPHYINAVPLWEFDVTNPGSNNNNQSSS